MRQLDRHGLVESLVLKYFCMGCLYRKKAGLRSPYITFTAGSFNMLEVSDHEKDVSLKEHGLKILEETHWKVKYLSAGSGVKVVGINSAKQLKKYEGNLTPSKWIDSSSRYTSQISLP